jgi:hypothetical protein
MSQQIDDCVQCGKSNIENNNQNQICKTCKLIYYCSTECQVLNEPNHSLYCRKYEDDHIKTLLDGKRALYKFISNPSELLLIWKEIMSEEFKTKGRGVVLIDLNYQFDENSFDSRTTQKMLRQPDGQIATKMDALPWTYMAHDHEILNGDRDKGEKGESGTYQKLKNLLREYDPSTQLVVQVINYLPQPGELKETSKKKNKKKKQMINKMLYQPGVAIINDNVNDKIKFIHLECIVDIDKNSQQSIINYQKL